MISMIKKRRTKNERLGKLVKDIEESIRVALKDVTKNPSKVYSEADLVHLIRSSLEKKKNSLRNYQIHQEVNRSDNKSDRGKFDLVVTDEWSPRERSDLRRGERRKKVRPKLVIEVKHLDPGGEGLAGDLAGENSRVGKDVRKLKKWINSVEGRKAFLVVYSVARGARGDVEERLKELLLEGGFDEQNEITGKTCFIVFLLVPPSKNLREEWIIKSFPYETRRAFSI